jgi:hypothetical protein
MGLVLDVLSKVGTAVATISLLTAMAAIIVLVVGCIALAASSFQVWRK